MDYGEHTIIFGTEVTLTASSPVQGEDGQRFICTGWTGTGNVPETGQTNTVTFLVSNSTTLVWQWVTEYALVQTSTVDGVVDSTSWHLAGSQAATLEAPAHAAAGGILYRFCQWRVDGARYPDVSGPAYNPANALLMDATHVALARYLPADEDSDDSGLFDWFENVYFGNDAAGAEEDSDADGANNLHEQYAGTDPTDPDSIFKVNIFNAPINDASSYITIGTVPRMFYAIDFCPPAGANKQLMWQPFTNQQNGVGSWLETGSVEAAFTFTDDFTTNTSGTLLGPAGSRLYRVRVSRPDLP